MSTALDQIPEPPPGLTRGEPAWGVVGLFPTQGNWSEREYLDLDTNRLVEFSDGFVEFLPMPTTPHQRTVLFLVNRLNAFAAVGQRGEALIAGVRVRLWEEKFRQPDVVFMLAEHAGRITDEFWDGADLVMEVVSDGEADRHRDLVTKRAEYARAGIPEYWIVDRREGRVTVLALEGEGREYAVHGEFARGQTATSRLLPGFSLNVDEILAAGV